MIFFLLLTLISSYSFASEKFDFEKKILENATDFCSKGSKVACDTVKNLNKGPNDKLIAPSNSESDKKAMEDMSKKITACGSDINCIQKANDEFMKKSMEDLDKTCKAGSQDACFTKEHMRIGQESQEGMLEDYKKTIKR